MSRTDPPRLAAHRISRNARRVSTDIGREAKEVCAQTLRRILQV